MIPLKRFSREHPMIGGPELLKYVKLSYNHHGKVEPSKKERISIVNKKKAITSKNKSYLAVKQNIPNEATLP